MVRNLGTCLLFHGLGLDPFPFTARARKRKSEGKTWHIKKKERIISQVLPAVTHDFLFHSTDPSLFRNQNILDGSVEAMFPFLLWARSFPLIIFLAPKRRKSTTNSWEHWRQTEGKERTETPSVPKKKVTDSCFQTHTSSPWQLSFPSSFPFLSDHTIPNYY